METIETTATNGEQQTVRATVDQRAFFKSMRHLFASSFSVMGELVQNGRRAQATKIAITCDEAARLITVSDDGVGIDNFDVLLDLARSGWECTEVQLVEKPFGMGFFACAFAAQSVQVYSKGKRLVFSQDDVIEQRALSVQEQSEEERAAMGEWTTRIELVGASRDILGSQQQAHFKTHSFETRIHHLVCGFPLPVTYNGAPLAQHASLPALRDVCEATSIGHVHAVFMHAKLRLLHAPHVAADPADLAHIRGAMADGSAGHEALDGSAARVGRNRRGTGRPLPEIPTLRALAPPLVKAPHQSAGP